MLGNMKNSHIDGNDHTDGPAFSIECYTGSSDLSVG